MNYLVNSALRCSLAAVLLLFIGCGSSEESAQPAERQEAIVLTHINHTRPPLAEAFAQAEGTTAVAGEMGAVRVPLADTDIDLVIYEDHPSTIAGLSGSVVPSAAIFVVSGADGSFDEHEEQLRVASERGVPVAAAMMSSVHLIDDGELLDLVEQFDIGETLQEAGYSNVPVVRVSAVRATEGATADLQAIRQLTQQIRQTIR